MAVPSSPPSPGLLGLWRGERSSWRCTNNGGCRGITKVHRGITKVHRGITKVQSGAARCRRRGVVNPIHAAFIQGLGYSEFERVRVCVREMECERVRESVSE